MTALGLIVVCGLLAIVYGIWAIWSFTEIATNRMPPEWATRSSYVRMLLVGLLLQVVLQRYRSGLIPERSPEIAFEREPAAAGKRSTG